MKKILFLLAIAALSCSISISKTFAQSSFSQAILNCETYSKKGEIPKDGEIYTVSVSLNQKNDKCVYKEKIQRQGDDEYQLLTCGFKKGQLNFIANSMSKFYDEFKTDIAKNPIFEAKLTTNAEVFQKYLVDPQYCQITSSKKKK